MRFFYLSFFITAAALFANNAENAWLIQFRLINNQVSLVEKIPVYTQTSPLHQSSTQHLNRPTPFSYSLFNTSELVEEVFIDEPDIIRGEFENSDGTRSHHLLHQDTSDIFVVVPYSKKIKRVEFYRHLMATDENSAAEPRSMLIGEVVIDE